jgi:hypothetical protein
MMFTIEVLCGSSIFLLANVFWLEYMRGTLSLESEGRHGGLLSIAADVDDRTILAGSEAVSRIPDVSASRTRTMSTLEAFWDRAAISKLEAKFAVAKEMEAIPRLSIQELRAIVFQYRYFTQAFATDLAVLIARCPEGPLRSLLGRLLNEELGEGNPEAAHMRLYDRFLCSIGAIDPGAPPAQLRAQVHPRVGTLLDELRDRTARRPLLYAIGMRGVGGECVCGVYFSVMHVHLRQHPFVIQHESQIDWSFWDIHAGHADVEHNELVRAAVRDFVHRTDESSEVAELVDGFDYGTATWDAFWSTLYTEHVARSARPSPS